uniref:IF rod domain-containing protein n=1 Tax=Myotis lucifugus TaxID=59463 RepID=G1PZS4_MYOLU
LPCDKHCAGTNIGTRLASSMAGIYAGPGRLGSWISVSLSMSMQGSWGSRVAGGQSKKETMQCLNDHLASYLERMRIPEVDNWRLESKIQEHLEKKGPWAMRAQIFATSVDNAHIFLQIDNASLAADDFRVKYETELAIYQSVENDINGLRKVSDNIIITWLQLETRQRSRLSRLFFLKKEHWEEANGL